MTCNDVKLSKLARKAILPFVIAFAIGIGLNQLVNSFAPATSLTSRIDACEWSSGKGITVEQSPLTVLRVPEVDFSEGVKRSTALQASLKLRAVFAADGQVRDVSIAPMVPWGVSDSAAGTGEYKDTTGMLLEGKFVQDLPYGLVETAIDQVRNIQFIPKRINGQPVSENVVVIIDLVYDEASNCEFINFTLMNDKGVLWGNTWVRGGPCGGS